MNSIITERLEFQKDTQDFFDYQVIAYDNWQKLLEKQLKNIESQAIQQFSEGLAKIRGLIKTIPNITSISQLLQEETGWQLFPVQGLLEAENYFFLLSHRYFPVATFVRSTSDINYSPQPDLWHDIFGHIPLLFDPTYSNFVQYLSHQYVARPNLREKIGRLYWYTIEAGVCYEEGELRVYGASQLSSIQEIAYAVSDHPTRYPFDLEKVMDCPVNIYQIQEQLFEIPSFDYLNRIQSEFDSYLSSL